MNVRSYLPYDDFYRLIITKYVFFSSSSIILLSEEERADSLIYCPFLCMIFKLRHFLVILALYLRKRSALAVNCLEVSCKEDQITSMQRSASDYLSTTDRQIVNYYSDKNSLLELIYFDSNTQ